MSPCITVIHVQRLTKIGFVARYFDFTQYVKVFYCVGQFYKSRLKMRWN